MAAPPSLDELAARVRKIAMSLPTAAETLVATGTARERRGAAGVADYAVSDRNFARIFIANDAGGNENMWLWVRTDPLERLARLDRGHPFVSSGGRAVGVVLESTTDWDEIEELITVSYLKVAPKKLAAQIEALLADREP